MEKPISFSLNYKPSEKIILTRDNWYPKAWDINFLCHNLSEEEKLTLITKVNNYIVSGEYLIAGEQCTKVDFQSFLYNTSIWEDTGMVRVVSNFVSPILKRK